MIELAIYALFVAIFRAYFSIKHFLGMQKTFSKFKAPQKNLLFWNWYRRTGPILYEKTVLFKMEKNGFFSEELMALSTNQKWKNLKLFTFSIVIYADPCPWNFIVKWPTPMAFLVTGIFLFNLLNLLFLKSDPPLL